MHPRAPRLARIIRACDPFASALAVAIQAGVFHLVPVVNRIYDGWPRGWLVLSVAILAALVRGTPPGVAALAAGIGLIAWRGTTFSPLHPGLEIFAALGLLQIAVIHRLRQRTAALRQSEVRFSNAFHGNAAGMLMSRAADGVILDANAAYERLTGYSRAELLGRGAGTLWRHPDQRAALVERLRREGGVSNFEADSLRKDGSPWTALVSAQIADIDDQAVIVSSVIDISERARAERTLAERSREKDQFLALLSHELRTPLNVILGYSRMLETPLATGDFVPKAVGIIRRNATTQLRLVEDLLDVQRIMQHGLSIERQEFALEALVHAVMESLRPTAAAKRLHWAHTIEPVALHADRARIEQVLWNLLSNAVKFTPEDGCIGVSARRVDHHVVLEIEDSGPGIPGDFLAHVFEPFRQLDMSSTRRHGGLGLGLAIARGIIEAHGGTIAAESPAAGQGARFTVRLPLQGGPPPPGTRPPL